MQLYLLRHATSLANVGNRLSCSLPGAALAPQGEEEVMQLAQQLAPDTFHIDTAYVSPFLRTQQTYNLLRQQHNYLPEPHIAEQIRELDFGDFDGQQIDLIEPHIKSALDRIIAGDVTASMGPNGETDYHFKHRVWGFLLHCLEHHHLDSILLVSHSATLSAIRRLIAEIDPKYPKTDSTRNATLIHFELHQAHTNAVRDAVHRLNQLHAEASRAPITPIPEQVISTATQIDTTTAV